jgi:DNA phosphorothioation-dependent restriction protein DptG
MALTKEDEERVREIAQTVYENQKGSRTTPEVRKFKQDIENWLRDSFPNDSDRQGRNSNRSGLYAVLRTRLDLSNIQNLRDGQIPEARQIFDEYKHLLSD